MFIPLRDENPTSRLPVLTIHLIAVNVAVFVLQAAVPQGLELAAVRFGAVPIFYIDVVPVPAGIVLGLWFLVQVLNVGMGGGVAWFAHIGGFLVGLLLIRLALGRAFRRPFSEAS